MPFSSYERINFVVKRVLFCQYQGELHYGYRADACLLCLAFFIISALEYLQDGPILVR